MLQTNDKDEVPSTACAKPRVSDPSPTAPALPSPAAIADQSSAETAEVDAVLAKPRASDPSPAGPPPTPAATAETEAAEVDAVLDAWARGPETPPAAQELRRTIKRARSTSDAKDSPTP